MTDDLNARLRALPSVREVLERPAVAGLVAAHGRATVVAAVRALLDEARLRVRGEALAGGQEAPEGRGAAGQGTVPEGHGPVDSQEAPRGRGAGEGAGASGRVGAWIGDEAIAERVIALGLGTLRPVINATGVLLHTNLGRAPLAPEALEAVRAAGRGYSSLELDLDSGERGDRHVHPVPLLRALTGAADAVVVNNNAAALLLALSAVAAGREVIVSRGELVEIGGGFRIPDVMRQSGARLVEVGTTNKTYRRDYAEALSEATGALLKVYPSAFAMVGFTAEAPVSELASLGRERGVPVIYDAGSGSLLPELPGEAVGARLREGADLVLFSGDKLLGGPQAGVVVGRADLIAKLRRHPLMRALRPDKLTLAALVATLRLWREQPERIPLVAMLRAPQAEIERRARELAAWLAVPGVEAAPCEGRMGGGAWAARVIPSYAVRICMGNPDSLAAALRRGAWPVMTRVEQGAVWIDLRTVLPDDEPRLRERLREVLTP